jgi:hypothetical protein
MVCIIKNRTPIGSYADLRQAITGCAHGTAAPRAIPAPSGGGSMPLVVTFLSPTGAKPSPLAQSLKRSIVCSRRIKAVTERGRPPRPQRGRCYQTFRVSGHFAAMTQNWIFPAVIWYAAVVLGLANATGPTEPEQISLAEPSYQVAAGCSRPADNLATERPRSRRWDNAFCAPINVARNNGAHLGADH